MSRYEVTIVTTYTQVEVITVEADNRDDAIDAAAVESEWDWSQAEEHNEIRSVRKIK